MIITLASSLVGVGITGTVFCDELLSNSREGTITSPSSTFLPLTSFERNFFSRKDPFLAKILPNHSSYGVVSTDLDGALFNVNAAVYNA